VGPIRSRLVDDGAAFSVSPSAPGAPSLPPAPGRRPGEGGERPWRRPGTGPPPGVLQPPPPEWRGEGEGEELQSPRRPGPARLPVRAGPRCEGAGRSLP